VNGVDKKTYSAELLILQSIIKDKNAPKKLENATSEARKGLN